MKLYEKCFLEENIDKAIKVVLSSTGAKTPGPDGINKYSVISQERYRKEVKLRLRGYKPVNSKTVEISKDNGKTRTITIINLFDRIAQQVVLDQISPVIEQNLSIHSYGFRKGIGTKIAVAKIANVVKGLKEQPYTIELDFKQCFDNIPLDKAIDSLRELGIRDKMILRVVKRLMYVSKEYNGIGISQGTILGPILCNAYLTKLDRFIETHLDLTNPYSHYQRDYERHSSAWLAWLSKTGKKINCRYYRYADDTIVICRNKEEQEEVARLIRGFVNESEIATINEDKSRLGYGPFNFLGYRIIKNKQSLWIKMDNIQKYNKELKHFKFNSIQNCKDFVIWLRGILQYYDIANDLEDFLNKIDRRLYYRSKNSQIRKVEGQSKYLFGTGTRITEIAPFEMRKASRISFKEYLVDSEWLTRREQLKNSSLGEWTIFKWLLFTIQKGKDKITGDKLDISHMDIHHINPRKREGLNSLDNLILINESTHKELHYGKTDNPKYRRYRKILNTKKD